tara:strand:+ start:289 stop:393 length:105 start_codon:yes stop_codon:yes gene_type:complete
MAGPADLSPYPIDADADIEKEALAIYERLLECHV